MKMKHCNKLPMGRRDEVGVFSEQPCTYMFYYCFQGNVSEVEKNGGDCTDHVQLSPFCQIMQKLSHLQIIIFS